MARMLYYSRANPPQHVLSQAVLYWDEVGSITPFSLPPSPEVRILRSEGLYRPVTTERLSGDRVNNIASQIEELLDRIPVEQLAIPDGPLTSTNRLYTGKLPERIEAQLMEYGVVRPDGDFYRGAGELLAPILSIAAREIADDASTKDIRRRWVCHTDLPQAFVAAYSGSATTENSTAWRLQLGELFPSPEPDVDLKQLLKFRLTHDDERRDLLRATEQLVASLGGQSNPDLLPELAAALDDAARRYRSKANKRGLRLATGAVTAAVGVEIGIMEDLSPIPGAGVVGAILLSAAQELVRRGPASPYTYLHRVEEQFQAQRPAG